MSGTGWTEAEKVGLLFQIIEKAGTIPWDDLKLPEGRTKKACAVMIDKEKSKVRKARDAEAGGEGTQAGGDGDEGNATPKAKAGGKRKVNDEVGTTPKKPKTPRKKKETVKAGANDEDAVKDGDDEEMVKAEPKEEEDDML